MQYLTDIDMSQNEIQNVVIHPTSVAPENPKLGQMYTDTSGNAPKLMWFNGTKWISIGAAAEVNPSKINPSVEFSVSTSTGAGSAEVGTKVPLSYKATLNPGSYTYGPETGVVAESWRIYDSLGLNESTEPVGTFNDVPVDDGTDYQLFVEVTHSAGAIPVTDQGSAYPEAQILAGTLSKSADAVSGFRKYFYGSILEYKEELTSEDIRGLTHSEGPIGDSASFNLKIENNSSLVVIAFPSNTGKELTSVIDTGAFGIEVYDVFKKTIIPVTGANNYDAIDYDVYVYAPDVTLSANTYKVTIS